MDSTAQKVLKTETQIPAAVAADQLRDLSELQLALVGGGMGETIL